MKRSATREADKQQFQIQICNLPTEGNPDQEDRQVNYLYPPVEAQTSAPLSNNVCTQTGCFWRAAKCKGVAPLPSLIFTNRANPLQSNPIPRI